MQLWLGIKWSHLIGPYTFLMHIWFWFSDSQSLESTDLIWISKIVHTQCAQVNEVKLLNLAGFWFPRVRNIKRMEHFTLVLQNQDWKSNNTNQLGLAIRIYLLTVKLSMFKHVLFCRFNRSLVPLATTAGGSWTTNHWEMDFVMHVKYLSRLQRQIS